MVLKTTGTGTEAGKDTGTDNSSVDAAALAATQAVQAELDTLKEQLAAKTDEAATLTGQLADAQAKGEQALAELGDTHKGEVLTLNNKISDLEGKLTAANEALATAKADAAGKPAKPAKAKIVSVISATDYSYLVDGDVRVTPDKAVRCELREGNLLHSQIEAGLIKLYDADED